jgi:hypothetical protein
MQRAWREGFADHLDRANRIRIPGTLSIRA